MRNKTGIFCMILGAALILGALSLYIHNEKEAASADQAAAVLLPELVEQIAKRKEAAGQVQDGHSVNPEYLNVPTEYLEPEDLEMPRLEIGGHECVGYLSIPDLGLELPVMADWSYPKLRLAPCRYAGSVRSDDLVLMAHNYARHFGRLPDLRAGDSVAFTDADGVVTWYEVIGMEVLDPYSVEEVTSGAFDLTLFTCTYGGQSRVTVYCDRISG